MHCAGLWNHRLLPFWDWDDDRRDCGERYDAGGDWNIATSHPVCRVAVVDHLGHIYYKESLFLANFNSTGWMVSFKLNQID